MKLTRLAWVVGAFVLAFAGCVAGVGLAPTTKLTVTIDNRMDYALTGGAYDVYYSRPDPAESAIATIPPHTTVTHTLEHAGGSGNVWLHYQLGEAGEDSIDCGYGESISGGEERTWIVAEADTLRWDSTVVTRGLARERYVPDPRP